MSRIQSGLRLMSTSTRIVAVQPRHGHELQKRNRDAHALGGELRHRDAAESGADQHAKQPPGRKRHEAQPRSAAAAVMPRPRRRRGASEEIGAADPDITPEEDGGGRIVRTE